ncbi:hypothetical protein IEQ34_026682 [Dendrobium chrysotoxum]|uniref:Peripheral subunit-binding (PSBD) domain-containing protein n=1 Tax=Dendrobium chrysotoxum TaxID=161865 RepID=A0AAV7FLH8_DENCH|nr:hypothetical protein IEQ34_026682 [Dendrobium chrysotoxum]
MLFADDILLVDKTKEGVEGKLEVWRSTLESKGFRLSRSKTEYMECNFSSNRPSKGIVTLGDRVINKSTRFRYLGSIVQSDGEIDGDVISRIQVGWLKWRNASGLLCDRKVPLKLKGKFYKMVVKPAMLYGAECWPLKEKHNTKLCVAEMRMLRWMSGFTLRDRIRNEHIREKVGVAPVEDKIRESRLRWFGQIKRRPSDDPVRKVEVLDLTYVKKGRGRPKKTCYLAKIITPEGSKDVRVGQPIAITVEDLDEIKDISAETLNGFKVKEEKPVQYVEPKEQELNSHRTNISRFSPSAKLLIAEHGIDVSSLKASGPRGTLLKGDVLALIKGRGGSQQISQSSDKKTSTSVHSFKQTAASSSSSETLSRITAAYEDLQNSQIRKVIAKRLLESKQNTPHFYLSSDVILDPLLAFRTELREQHNVKVSVNDIVIKAVALALRNVPEANAYWSDEKGEATILRSIDISIAVATEKGLMTPIIRNADEKTLSAISSEVKELAERARNGKLKPEQFQGGTFSISNLGMFPVDHFCAIINPPQACILAVGRGNKVVEPVKGSDGIEKPGVVTKMSLKLSADHRVIDAEIGGKFLGSLSSNFSDLRRLLL